MKVKFDDLRILLDKILKHLEEDGIKSVELESDYYWNIPKEYLYDSYEEPKELDMGQLYDDMEFLNNILEGRNEPIGHALVWLSAILRYIGEENVA